ncbi:hypothetical protein NQ314_013585 [Rhamnusium bicolor]|uniref:Carboxylesterase type B domain-containing protein n=1 Tax=Rhamnusium bicolor TaxID=1586634 RepID=A0AAV8X5U5_9CUCU|nr:hypothetical protein NQ314_013585 [Rhamnusium bicolor]
MNSFNKSNDIVGHGDDLAYLFDVNDIEGNSLESGEKLNEDDKKVRDLFTQMISDFARHGKIQVNGKEVEPFSGRKNNFIQISAKPTVADNFKFCEMALWSNLAERLKSNTCSFLEAFKVLPPLPALPGVLSNITNPLNIKQNLVDPNNPLQILNKSPLNMGGSNIIRIKINQNLFWVEL